MTTVSAHSTMSLALMVAVVAVVRMVTPFPFEGGLHSSKCGSSGNLKQAGLSGIPENKITSRSNIYKPTSLGNTKLVRQSSRDIQSSHDLSGER
jgi:hypothetical protein